MAEEEMVEISKVKLERMEKELRWLYCLEAAGVDNWQGIDYAYDMRRAEEGEDEDG